MPFLDNSNQQRNEEMKESRHRGRKRKTRKTTKGLSATAGGNAYNLPPLSLRPPPLPSCCRSLLVVDRQGFELVSNCFPPRNKHVQEN